LPESVGRHALTDVDWRAGPGVAVAMCGPTAEHRLFDIPMAALQ
jgi:hypothetical protein